MTDAKERRLSAVLMADVVGYTKLVEEDTDGTVAAWTAARANVIEPVVGEHSGQIVKFTGDGFLAEFSSVQSAVICAINLQRGLGTSQLEFRLGISLGDVIDDGTDIHGEGVNIAARIETLAEPGGICVSGDVYNQVRNRVDANFKDMGEHTVKHVSSPVRVYRWVEVASDTIPDAVNPDDVPALPKKPSIAVLPFTNMSGDPEQEYFSDGITEDIINALSHFRSFPVIARNSTFTYKGQSIRVQQVAAELGARYVLEGSVRKARNRIRITAQLIDAETGHHMWAGKFDSTMDDIFDVQDEISQKIVATIQPELAQAELEKAAVKRPESLTAWDLVLRGMALVNRHTPEDHKPARELFRSAIELAPNYADAWSGIAWSYLANVILVGTNERQVLMKKGLEAAMQAVKLDDRSAFAHYVLGVAYAWDEQYQKAISEGEISLQLNPYSAQTHMGLGNRLDLAGRTEEGIIKMEQGLQLSPRDPFCPTIMSYLSRAYLSLEKPERALEWIEKAVNLKPQNSDLQYRYAICLAHLDRIEDAKRALSECERQQPGFLAMRKHWRPYPDDDRNQRFFGGFLRHHLLSDYRATTGIHK